MDCDLNGNRAPFPGVLSSMSARLSVDTDLVRSYGSAASAHAADLHEAAGRLAAVPPGSAAFGPVGARFLAALARAATDESQVVAALSGALTAAQAAAAGSAQAYDGADAGARHPDRGLMPSALVAALAAPIRRVQALVGPGLVGRSVRRSGRGADRGTRHADRRRRRGAGRPGAQPRRAGRAAARTPLPSSRRRRPRRSTRPPSEPGGWARWHREAAGAVAAAHRRLQDIVDEFEARAAALEPRLDQPGVAKELLTEARDALGAGDRRRRGTARRPGRACRRRGQPAGSRRTGRMVRWGRPDEPGGWGARRRVRGWTRRWSRRRSGGVRLRRNTDGHTRGSRVRGRRGRAPARRDRRDGAERGGRQRRSARADPARRAVPVGRHDAGRQGWTAAA